MRPEEKVLGQKVDYPQHYDKSVLVAIPRYLNREYLDIKEDALPFVGADIWHAYEFSFLTKKGLPVVGVFKFSIPADSACIVESKSLKLYLNSFNMSLYGDTRQEGIGQVLKIIKRDLSQLLSCDVELAFIAQTSDKMPFESAFELLENAIEVDSLTFETYNEDENLLEGQQGVLLQVKSQLLRSNCKVTNQPDWGDIYIHLKGSELPTHESLLKYIVSFRNEQHFHEEICEAIYERLNRLFAPEELMVACLYTRRGGIDICPVRATSKELLNHPLLDVNILDQKLLRS